MAHAYAILGTALIVSVLTGTIAAAAPPPTAVPGEADLPVLLDTIRANRRALVAVNLKLDEQQSARFWPIYDRYQREMNAIGDRIAALVKDYAANFHNLSNDKALQLIREYLAAEADRIKVRQAYLDEFTKALPGQTVARFYQMENKMDAVIRYELASNIPVVEDGSSRPAK